MFSVDFKLGVDYTARQTRNLGGLAVTDIL